MSGKRIIVGISGADGVSLGVRLLSMLRGMEGVETLLIMSRAAERNLEIECRTAPEEVRALANRWYEPEDMAAEVSSGSFWTDGMIVAPCSMKTLAAIAHGYSENLLVRAADVCLKEGRKVVLMPRETPLGIIHIKNMLAAAEAGCAIVPPMLTYYNRPESLDEVADHVLGKVLMQFGLIPPGFRPWGGTERRMP